MYEAIASNKRRTIFLIFIFLVFISLIVFIFAKVTRFGPFIIPIAIVFAVGMSFSSYYYSDKIVLTMSRARPLEHNEYPWLDDIIEGIAIAAGIPKPKPYIIDDPSPNAFATGRDPNHAVIAVTRGLLEKLNHQEIEGVIGHEMSHIRNYDIRLMATIVVLVGIIVLMSDFLLRSFLWGSFAGDRDRDAGGGAIAIVLIVVGLILAILSPIFATLIQLSISRKREFLADATGAELTRYPPGLANALKKLSADKEKLKSANKATAHLYIVNPLKAHGGRMNSLFDTHPPIEERIKRLEEM